MTKPVEAKQLPLINRAYVLQFIINVTFLLPGPFY